LHEIKIAGYRAQVQIHHGLITVYARSGYNWTDHFQPIAHAAGDRGALCRNWQSVRSPPLPQIRHQMMDHLVLIRFHPVHQSLNQDDDPNEVSSSRKSHFSIHQHRQDG
jgi:hypothetical protein